MDFRSGFEHCPAQYGLTFPRWAMIGVTNSTFQLHLYQSGSKNGV
jgi:hypothetical protein